MHCFPSRAIPILAQDQPVKGDRGRWRLGSISPGWGLVAIRDQEQITASHVDLASIDLEDAQGGQVVLQTNP
jgi:hypothetical protein